MGPEPSGAGAGIGATLLDAPEAGAGTTVEPGGMFAAPSAGTGTETVGTLEATLVGGTFDIGPPVAGAGTFVCSVVVIMWSTTAPFGPAVTVSVVCDCVLTVCIGTFGIVPISENWPAVGGGGMLGMGVVAGTVVRGGGTLLVVVVVLTVPSGLR